MPITKTSALNQIQVTLIRLELLQTDTKNLTKADLITGIKEVHEVLSKLSKALRE